MNCFFKSRFLIKIIEFLMPAKLNVLVAEVKTMEKSAKQDQLSEMKQMYSEQKRCLDGFHR